MRDSPAPSIGRAFAGDTIVPTTLVTVLGLVDATWCLTCLIAVATEDAPASFAMVEAAIERGYDLRLLCRELARATRESADPVRRSKASV